MARPLIWLLTRLRSQAESLAEGMTRKLTEQLVYLERNTLAIEKARDAYRQQFDIGQRSLLDLLNAENEVYTARRAYANAEHDLALAYARTHAAMNRLGTTLGIARTESSPNIATNSPSLTSTACAASCPRIAGRNGVDMTTPRIALIGCGLVGQKRLNLLPPGSVTMACDLDIDRASVKSVARLRLRCTMKPHSAAASGNATR